MFENDFDRNFNRVNKTVWTSFWIIAVFTVITVIASSVGLIYGCRKIEQHGLKGVVSSIWNSPRNTELINH